MWIFVDQNNRLFCKIPVHPVLFQFSRDGNKLRGYMDVVLVLFVAVDAQQSITKSDC